MGGEESRGVKRAAIGERRQSGKEQLGFKGSRRLKQGGSAEETKKRREGSRSGGSREGASGTGGRRRRRKRGRERGRVGLGEGFKGERLHPNSRNSRRRARRGAKVSKKTRRRKEGGGVKGRRAEGSERFKGQGGCKEGGNALQEGFTQAGRAKAFKGGPSGVGARLGEGREKDGKSRGRGKLK